VRFALDDFGSGMSSFAYLKALPVDFLKIDGSFVRRIAFDPVDHAMVEAINKLGHVMKISTVAEFSENEAVLALLRQMGVDFAQGNGIAEPRPLTEVLPLPPQGVTPMRTALPLRHGARQA
jgi:EAL domain-containing protein (putative c-di-GMP-specific phosphodiesterase class I)